MSRTIKRGAPPRKPVRKKVQRKQPLIDRLLARLAEPGVVLRLAALVVCAMELVSAGAALLGAVQHTATEQKAAIDRMVASTARWLDEAGARFTEKVDGLRDFEAFENSGGVGPDDGRATGSPRRPAAA